MYLIFMWVVGVDLVFVCKPKITWFVWGSIDWVLF